ncbi:MAG: site-specific integrase [Raoultibacter sp.]
MEIRNQSVTALEHKERSKCRKWRLRVGTDSGHKTKRFSGTYTQAKDHLVIWINELTTPPPPEDTFASYATVWYNRRVKRGEIASGTLRNDHNSLKRINKRFGTRPIIAMTKREIEDGLLDIKHDSPEKPLSGTYMNKLYTTMKSVLESAVDDEIIPVNPMYKIKAPKLDTGEKKSLPQEQFAAFIGTLSASAVDAHVMAVEIAVLAGLRRGEVLGLQWGDFDGEYLHVRRSMSEEKRNLKCPKSEKSKRSVPVIPLLGKMLDRWGAVQEKQFSKWGASRDDETHIITSDVLQSMHPQCLDRWWRKNRDALGVSGYTLHELRHTFLTMCANSGAGIHTIKDLAGWADISMANTYIHASDDLNKKAIADVAKMIDFEGAKRLSVSEIVPNVVPPSKKEAGQKAI